MKLRNVEVNAEVLVEDGVTDQSKENLEHFLQGYINRYLQTTYSDLWEDVNELLADYAEDNFVHSINGPFVLRKSGDLEHTPSNSFPIFDPALYEDGYITEEEYERIESGVKEALEDAAESYDEAEHEDYL